MFTDADFALTFAPVAQDPQIVLIPVDETQGVIAVTKAFGNGRAACIVFAPAIPLGTGLDGYTPQYLRKVVTSDFALRTGKWAPVGLTSENERILRDTVSPLMVDMQIANDETIEIIDMERPTNMSSSPAVACTTYRAAECTPFESALSHLLDLHTAKRAV